MCIRDRYVPEDGTVQVWIPFETVTLPSKDVPLYSLLQSDWVGPLFPVAPQFVKVYGPDDEDVLCDLWTAWNVGNAIWAFKK